MVLHTKDKKRVLIATGIFPPDYGGPASYVPVIADGLGQRMTVVAVVTLSDEPTADDSIFPFKVIRLPRRQNKLLRVIRTIATLWRLGRQADVVFLNGLVFEGVIACKVLSRLPVVVKVVGDLIWERARRFGATDDDLEQFQEQNYGLKWAFLKKLQCWYTSKADLVITPSRYLAGIVEGWGIAPNRIRVIYNAVEPPVNEQASDDTSFEVVTVARLVPWKGIGELVDLAKKNEWRLLVVGDGPLLPALKERVQRLSAPVSFVGAVPREQVTDYMRSARVFVLNSSYEGLPHVVLEAMAAGVPVVATDVGGISEVLANGSVGELIDPAESGSLERAIQRILDDPTLAQSRVAAASELVKTRFGEVRMVEETTGVLLESIVKGYE